MQFPARISCLALLLVACGGSLSDAADPAPSGPMSAAAAAKAKFTKYAPQYPGSRIVSYNEMAMGQGKMQVIVLRTEDDRAKVIAFYKEQAAAAGFDAKVNDGPSGTILMLSGPGLPVLAGASISVNPSGALPGVTMMLPVQ